MPDFKFTPEDFYEYTRMAHENHFAPEHIADMCCDYANARLTEWLKNAPVVYGLADENGLGSMHHCRREKDIHRAQLVCIEDLKNE